MKMSAWRCQHEDVCHLLSLVDEYSSTEQEQGQEDVEGEGELVREEEAGDDRREHVGHGHAVLLHDVVQPLQDGGNHLLGKGGTPLDKIRNCDKKKF